MTFFLSVLPKVHCNTCSGLLQGINIAAVKCPAAMPADILSRFFEYFTARTTSLFVFSSGFDV